ncbi:cytochrome c-type biogenesis protein CcmH [Klebsiella variicola subsp. variicola]|nr:cytochrome c-type biogenesis protein CcmH [Klebsiella variicola subsp. variicola]
MGILLALMLTGQAWAVIDTWQFKDEAQSRPSARSPPSCAARNARTTASPTQTAMIAADMRQKVYELMQQGKTKGRSLTSMVARYGHFVSYEPPLTVGTVLLLAGAGAVRAGGRRGDYRPRASSRHS